MLRYKCIIRIAAIFLLLNFLTEIAKAQQNAVLEINLSDLQDRKVSKKLNYSNKVADSLSAVREIKNVLSQLFEEGYLTATTDTLIYKKDTIEAYLLAGNRYHWVKLGRSDENSALLSLAGFREDNFNNREFHYSEVHKLMQRLLAFFEDNGYPFAEVKLKDVLFGDSTISGTLSAKKHQLIKIDSITISGNVVLNEKYLYNYIGIKPGDLYNESLVRKVNDKLKRLRFIEPEKPVAIRFKENSATINIYLKERASSRFNGVIGVLPNSNTAGKLLVTGELSLLLTNPFGAGRMLQADWRRLQEGTQDLQLKMVYPYIFHTPLGIDFDFKLYKKDSSFLELNSEFGFLYQFSGNNFLKAFIADKRSTLLTVDKAAIISKGRLPENIDYKTLSYGISQSYNKLNDLYSPTRGFSVSSKIEVGTREIVKNNQITEIIDTSSGVNFKTLYDSLDPKLVQYRFSYYVDWYFSLRPRSIIKLSGQGSGLFMENIFNNELYRLGGVKDLRGFNEESIRASLYNIFTVEYRYLLQQNSYLFLFFDGAHVENKTEKVKDYPFGFGTGVSFRTEAGIFTLGYALGRQLGNPVELRAAKIHFGYINYF